MDKIGNKDKRIIIGIEFNRFEKDGMMILRMDIPDIIAIRSKREKR